MSESKTLFRRSLKSQVFNRDVTGSSLKLHVYNPNIVSQFSGDDYIVLNGKTSVHRVRVVQEFRYESYLINVTDNDE